MQTIKWGPGLWTSLHCMTFNYPENPSEVDKDNYKNFFNLLSVMLPCVYCRDSYRIYIKYFKIEDFYNSRIGLCFWLYTLHNIVNEKIGKPLITFNKCIKIYENMRAKCGAIKENDVKFNTCIQKQSIDTNEINKIYNKLDEELLTKAFKAKEELKNDPENPNNNICICRLKINYDEY